MSKRFKKVTAWVCAVAMLVAGLTITPSKTFAADGDAVALAWTMTSDNAKTATFTDTSDDTSIGYTIENFTTDYTWSGDSKWQGQVQAAGITVDTSKYYKLVMNMSASADKNIVVQLANAGYSFLIEKTVNTSAGTYEVVFKPTDATINLTIAFGATSAAEAGTYDSIALSGITLTETEETTTEKVTEAPTQGEDGYTNCVDQTNTDVGAWWYYVGSWAGATAKYKGGETLDDFSLSVLTNNKGEWGIQAYTDLLPVTAGKEYAYSITLNSNTAGASVTLKEDSGVGDLQTLTLVEGDNVFEGTFTANDADAKIFFDLDQLDAGTTVSVTSFSLEEAAVEPTEAPTGEGETSTEAPTEPGATTWKEIGEGYSYDTNTTVREVVNIQQPGFATEKGIYVTVPAGISAVSVNGVTENVAGIEGAGTVVYLSAFTKNINEVVITYAGGTATLTVKNDNVAGGEEPTSEQTTGDVEVPTEAPTEEPTAPAEPTWKAVDNGPGYYYNTDTTATIVNVQQPAFAAEQGIYMTVPAGISAVSVNGVTENVAGIEGAGVVVYLSALTSEINTVVIEYAGGTATVSIKKDAGEEPTEAPTGEGETSTEAPAIAWTELFNNGKGTATDTSTEDALGAVFTGFSTDMSWGGDSKWHGQAKKSDIPVTTGKTYKVSFDIVSTPAKQILVQALSGGIYTENTYASADGSIEMTFEATADTAQIVIAFGAMSEAEVGTYDVTISNFKVEESDEPVVTTCSVTVDGTEIAAVEAGETVTLPTEARYGYYINGAMYKAGATVTVESDMAFTSVNTLSVTVANGAGIKLDGNGTSGIRFQAKVTSNNMDAVASDAIKEGMLITANDLYEELGNSALNLYSKYTVKNIVNNGWYNGTVGTYCASIVDIIESNYIRDFIARAYTTITYVDGTTVTVYSGMSQVRNIAQVADLLIANGDLGQYTAAQQAIINTFAAAN